MANDNEVQRRLQHVADEAPRRLIEDLREYAAHEMPNIDWTPELAAMATALADALDEAVIDRADIDRTA